MFSWSADFQTSPEESILPSFDFSAIQAMYLNSPRKMYPIIRVWPPGFELITPQKYVTYRDRCKHSTVPTDGNWGGEGRYSTC